MIKKAIVLGAALAGMGLFAATAQATPVQSRDVLDTQLVGPITVTALSHNPWTSARELVRLGRELAGLRVVAVRHPRPCDGDQVVGPPERVLAALGGPPGQLPGLAGVALEQRDERQRPVGPVLRVAGLVGVA